MPARHLLSLNLEPFSLFLALSIRIEFTNGKKKKKKKKQNKQQYIAEKVSYKLTKVQ